MPQFILLCHDKPNSAELRQATRPAHLNYAAEHGSTVLIAGPMLDDAGGPIGSMFVVEAPDVKAVADFAAGDPYSKAGLFAETQITPYRISLGTLAPKD